MPKKSKNRNEYDSSDDEHDRKRNHHRKERGKKHRKRNNSSSSSKSYSRSRSKDRKRNVPEKRQEQNLDIKKQKSPQKSVGPPTLPVLDDAKEKERKMQERLARARALKCILDDQNDTSKLTTASTSQSNPVLIQETKPIALCQTINSVPLQSGSNGNSRGNTILEELEMDEEKPPNEAAIKIQIEPPSIMYPGSYHKEPSKPAHAYNAMEVDPLDQFFMEMEKSAVPQEEFQLIHRGPMNVTKFIDIRKQQGDEEKPRYDKSKVITFEDLTSNNRQMEKEEMVPSNLAPENENEMLEEQDKKFIEALKNQRVKQLRDSDDEAINPNNEILSEEEDGGLTDNYFITLEENLDFMGKIKTVGEKKELKAVDHSTIAYKSFRKNLYVECKEIKELKDVDVNNLRKELGDIKVRGINVPKPIQNWYQCGLPDSLLDFLKYKKKFSHPFPIQCQAIPAIMSGRDIIGIAETGSGKTLAYVLPMLRHIADQPPLEEGDGPIALIMAPTRELANQIHRDTKSFAKHINRNIVCIYGGASIAGQLSALKKGCEIVVCTPGRMIDVLTTNNGRITNLKRVTYVVLDEADRMFDLGFEPQITRILMNIRPDRQTVMFSATFPKCIENLAKKILIQPLEIVVGNRGQTCKNVIQTIEVRSESTKLWRLLEILGEWSEKGSILIFVDKQTEADELFKELLKYGYQPLVLHGGQDAEDREFTIHDFRKGLKKLMVATSVCARGLDIKNIVLVINFKCPNHSEDYIHRVGRTGRGGKLGHAMTFITPEEDQYASELIKALQLSGNIIPEELKQLHNKFKKKVEEGEAKEYKVNRGFNAGQGFKFNEEEFKKFKTIRDIMVKDFGLDIAGTNETLLCDDFEDVNLTKINEKEARNIKNDQRKAEREALRMIKDPQTRQAIISAATKAAKEAILAGASQEEVILAAQNAIKSQLLQFKPAAHSLEKGVEQAMKVIDDIESKADQDADHSSMVLEINDYPTVARNKVTNKDYVSMVMDLTSTQINVRGVHVEGNKKPPIGQKKLYMHISGDSKYNVQSAYKELKKTLEDASTYAHAAGYHNQPNLYWNINIFTYQKQYTNQVKLCLIISQFLHFIVFV